ncbi:MAG: TonB-dependent receptor, partial [Desulfobacterales bacterium]
LTSITARREASYGGQLDFDFGPMELMDGYQDATHEKISEELRLSSNTGKFEWIVGLYYDTDNDATITEVKSMIPSMASLSDVRLTDDAYAIFGQIGYSLTEQLKIIGGFRYEKQDMTLEGNIPAGRLDGSWEKITPKITLEYKITPDIMTYAGVSQGYRPGGFNELATAPRYYSYDEESLWAYEIGLKSLLMDKRIMLNAALFYMDITDMQVSEKVDPYVSWNTNAAEATSMGAEIEITARITDGLSLMGGFGYTNCEFDTFSDAKGNYAGNKNPYAPEYTFNIGSQYRHASGFYARADFIGYGKMFFDNANQHVRDAYQIVNAKIGYEGEHFDVYLYGKNIFDEEYDSVGYFNGFYTLYSDPGEFGLQVTYRF